MAAALTLSAKRIQARKEMDKLRLDTFFEKRAVSLTAFAAAAGCPGASRANIKAHCRAIELQNK
ncbi:MAG: hypothetical protein DI585_01205 [Pseudomonas fluorescens]|nr:MAG: hypothetical protein DI585_01205 [Pseudomonas fluorescens]